MTSRVSADITSHKVAGVTHRGSVAAGSPITLWDGRVILKPGGGACEGVCGRQWVKGWEYGDSRCGGS